MARYKYSENTKEVTDIYFDTETHGEFMGMEQGGEMKKVSTLLLKDKLISVVHGLLDIIKGVGWNGETIKGNADNLEAHEQAEAPHIFKNLKTGKEYEFGFQVSSEGHPQIIYKEI